MSVRLAKKIHPYISSRSRDIYPYLATKDGLDSAEPMREEHGGTSWNSTPPTYTPKKKCNISLADEGAKAVLIEQWASLRMSQGTLLSSTSADRRNELEIPSGEVAEPDKPPDFVPASDDIEPTCPRLSVSSSNLVTEPPPEMSVTNESVVILAQAEGLSAQDNLLERLPLSGYDLRYPSLCPEDRQPTIEDIAPLQYADEETVETIAQAPPHSPTPGPLEVVNQSLQLLATDCEVMSLHSPSTRIMSNLETLPETTISAGPVEPEDSSTRASAADIRLVVSTKSDVDDVVMGFHMLDLHEVLSPWVPVSPTAPSVYVPPAVHHLIAGTYSSCIALH